MMRSGLSAVLVVLICAIVSPAQAQTHSISSSSARNATPFMHIYGPSNPPYGYVNFCDKNPAECRVRKGPSRRIQLTPALFVELDQINRMVNKAIKPVTDYEAHGVSELWTVPVTKGDCEDYALLKRRLLRAQGWPESSLLLTVVRDERGDGHAVLTLRTAQGDFVADNKTNEILSWNQTPYSYVMRQSYLNPQNWMRLDPIKRKRKVQLSGSRR